MHFIFAVVLVTTTPLRSFVIQDESAKAAVQLAQYPGAPFEDTKGNLWFGTVGEGLIRFDGSAFVTFTTKDGLAGNSIRGILEDEQANLWFATTGGVSKYDGKAFTSLLDYGDLKVTDTFGQGGDHLDIWSLLFDRKGALWMSSMDGVFRYDGQQFNAFPLPVVGSASASEFSPKMVYTIYEDSEGVLWFGTDGAGAVSYDGTSMTVYTEKDNGLCSDRVCEILEDSRGVMWFGTSTGGVSQFKDGKFTTHLRSKTKSIHTGWGRYMSIHEDRQGNVWFGASMQGGGVHRYDGKNFRFFSTKDGLGTGGVPSIREDRSGNLWFGTTEGVYRFDGERFVNFARKD